MQCKKTAKSAVSLNRMKLSAVLIEKVRLGHILGGGAICPLTGGLCPHSSSLPSVGPGPSAFPPP